MQHLGLIALIPILPMAIIIAAKFPLVSRLSASENIARNRYSQLLFSTVFTPVTVLYYSFLVGWLGPHYGVSWVFYLLTVIAFFAQLIVTWVPARGKRALKVHTGAAYVVALVMPSIIGLILASIKGVSLVGAIASITFLLITLVIIVLFFFVPKARNRFTHFELGYFVSFWVVIILLTYL
ncbi:MAG: hypothetical protein WAO28_02935 [Candidatus Microsaccharimonas sp.]